MTQSYRGLCQWSKASQLPSIDKGDTLMSMNYGITPEEMLKKKKRNKLFVYATLFIGTILLSAAFTILANQL